MIKRNILIGGGTALAIIAAALIVLLGFAKSYAPHILGLAAVAVVVLNRLFA